MRRLVAEVRERARALLHRRAAEREMAEELEFHLAMETEANERRGLSPAEAVRRARLDFGGTERVKEEIREARGVQLADQTVRDIGLALRRLRASPGLTLVLLLTLALGIGATTAVYSVVRGVVLRPLAYPAPHELVLIDERTPDGSPFSTSRPTFDDIRTMQRSFSHVAAIGDRTVALIGDGEPVQLQAEAVTADFLPMLGVPPALGRHLLPADEARGERVVVLGHGLWAARFGASPDVIGRSILLDGDPFTVVGVMPERFASPGGGALWMPLPPQPDAEREDHELYVIARLAPGATHAGASAELTGIARRLGELYPETNGGWGLAATDLRTRIVGESWPRSAWLLMGAVSVLLLLACVNVASLLLARAIDRGREMGLRSALGASRGRLVRQIFAESLVLATLGAAGGLMLAVAGVPLLRAILPADTPRLAEVRVDGTALLLTAAVTVVVALLFGLAPAATAGRARPRQALADGARGERRGAGRLREVLVVAEVGLAMVLLVGAGLLMTSFLRLQRVDIGFATDELLIVPLTLPASRYDEAAVGRLVAAAEDRLGGVPGVVAAGGANVAPFGAFGTVTNLSIDGRPSGPGETSFARWRAVTPGFLRAAGVTIRQGRAFRAADFAPDAEQVIVVTETFAQRLFPGESSVERRVAMGVNGTNWRRIVGVVEDVRDLQVGEEPHPLFFMPGLGGWLSVTLFVRTSGDARALAAPVRAVIQEIDPLLPVPVAEPLRERLDRSTAGPRFNLLVMAAFGAVALTLAAIGVYGMMTYTVARRTKEFGIRLALGARPAAVRVMVLRRGGMVVAAGLVIGGSAAALLARVFGGALFGADRFETTTFVAVAAALALVGVAAAAIPAGRATRVNPMQALRVD